MKKNLITVLALAVLVASLSGCASLRNKINTAIGSFMSVAEAESTRVSGDGKTPMTAIVITPDKEVQESEEVHITVNDSERWFYVSMLAGKEYIFESVGKGDPSLHYYSVEQVSDDGTVSGEPVAMDLDSAENGSDAKFAYTSKLTAGYYLRVQLYAGGNWKGRIRHYVNM